MADSKKRTNGGGAAKDGNQDEPGVEVQVQVIGQFIKDLSFENPALSRLAEGQGESPSLKLEVNVKAERMGQPDHFESAIEFKAEAANDKGTFYVLEVVYAGLFRIRNLPEQHLEPFLLVNCPTLIFPFLCLLVADITREGGFPPLLLDPVDFGTLYMRRRQEAAESEGKGGGKA